MTIRKPDYTVEEVHAVRACIVGVASPGQAKLAFDWVMREAAKVNDLSFQDGGIEAQRATDFAEGRRFVGALIREMGEPMTLDLAQAKDEAKRSAARRRSP